MRCRRVKVRYSVKLMTTRRWWWGS